MTVDETRVAESEPRTPAEYLQENHEALQWAAGALFSSAIELGEWAEDLNWGDRLERTGAIKSLRIIKAFKQIRRWDFMPNEAKHRNGINQPVQIGHGQTISQPSTVGQMQEWLGVRRGQNVLDLGSGSGWTTALMASIVGEGGKVTGVEKVPELVGFGRSNIAKYGLQNVEIRQAGKKLGLPGRAKDKPFHRILVSAHLPEIWLGDLQKQLDPHNGRLVAPIVSEASYGKPVHDNDMVRVTREGDRFHREVLAQGYSFVPLINEADDQLRLETAN